MEKAARQPRIPSDRTLNIRLLTTLGVCSVLLYLLTVAVRHDRHLQTNGHPPRHAAATISRCHSLLDQVAAPKDFHKRSRSDRFVHGTKPVLIKRARIWTGRKNGTEVIRGDILLDKGLIKSVGSLHHGLLQAYSSDLIVVDAKDAWVTPGIVDIHSHLGDSPSPALNGAEDDNSPKGTIQPWLRSLDGLNTHDASYPLSIAGGVTTSLILPGSGNAIGGQAFVIKLRSTAERTPTSMLLEPPYNINSSFSNPNLPPRWRHMKHACGENPSTTSLLELQSFLKVTHSSDGQYKDTRMDTNWAFREAYKTAFDIKEKQDKYCSLALAGKWKNLGELPEDLQWEALVDVVRGKVKINAHCYEAVDLDALVRLSNEFKFPIAAFHHASEAYLVPDLLKKTYDGTPAIALFATNSRYKREAYRSSEFAPRILAQHGIKVLLKSDHPISNSRHLLYEAQQAYYYGFPENLAIASVTSNSAEVMGMGHRWDADLVIWDSHPLALGATPSQVFIDGIPQLKSVHIVQKPKTFQESPKVPNFDKEAADAVKYEGLPPIAPKEFTGDLTVFTNVKSVYKRTLDAVEVLFSVNGLSDELGVAVARNGSLVCSGMHADCLTAFDAAAATYVDLEGGSISPGLVSFGSPLGLHHIEAEDSTNDGDVFDPLVKGVPKILGGDTAIVRAVDGLLFGSRDAYLAYRVGVTSGITAPTHKNFYSGLGVSFSLGAAHKLEAGAVIQEVTGVHVSVRHFEKPRISTQIAALRRLLLGPQDGASGYWFKKVTEGKIPLVVEAHSADIIATLIILKREVEIETRKSMKMTITGAAEAHILAKELAEAGVGVILNPSRPFPYVWEDRRILPGPPLSRDGAVVKLMSHGVTVGIGCEEIWSARNLPFDVAWAAIEAGGRISRSQALAIGSVNVEKLLGVEVREEGGDLVATRGGELLDRESKVVGVLSARRVRLVGRGLKLKVRPLKTWTRTMAKKTAVVATRPISDFFTRKSAFNSSNATKSTLAVSDASSPTTSSTQAFMDAVEIVSPVRSAKHLLPPPMPLVKPANSPTIASLSPRPSSGARQQRKSIFDSDSDVEQPAPAVYILRSPARPTSAGTTLISSPAPLRATENLTTHSSHIRSNPKKKQRLSSPEPCSELVPTSQSDELDMAPTHSPQRDPLLVKRSVDEWRHSAISAPSLLVDDVFVDSPNKSAFNLHTTQPSPDRMSSLSPVPASPKALNPTTKAAQIIADIKAKAYAESLQNRPETPVREFKDELSDSSDDEMLPESPIRAKGKSTISKKPFASSSRPSGRYSLRNRDHSPSSSRLKHMSAPSPSSKRMRVASTRTPVISTAPTQKGKGKAYNPLDDLLKEKKRDDQRGKGSEALRQAEAALANRDAIIVDVDVNDDFTNEAAARKAVSERRRLALKSSSPMAHDASESEQELDDEDRARLLGEQNGKAIVNMLDSDRASKQREKETEKPVGVPLWQMGEELDGFMDVDEAAPPPLNISNPHPIMSVLQGAIQRNDLVQATMLIGTGAISSINLAENTIVIPYLCQLALSSEETTVSKSALQVLNHIWDTSIPPLPGISFVCILSTLARLGAQSAVLSAMGWSAPHMQPVSISSRTRDSVLYRLVMLVTASARSRRLSAEEIPDILMSMVLLANEPSSSPELQVEVMLSIDAVCGSIASGDDISAFLESTICTRLLKYVSTLEPVNKAYIVALLGSGIGRTQRIARWVAHGIITNKQAISLKRYTDLPPLFPLVVELTRKRTGNNDSELGHFEQHENTDFVDMAFYVQILGVAITNVIGYVMEERNAPRPRPSSSHDTVAPAQPAEPPLALIRLAIENVHSKISDIRATHLDRSRTKGALKELSLRIYYQRQTALQSARTLHTYFTKRKKPNGASS
ncbi:hypothetical protein D9615_004477 [Tricholomella constricta]|uniref:Amidohydrolase-related domain-containing protein n=1 Tax=Tricholomella constricta TaxID=117010 RepID=A0A8H5HCD7_9AGAR|nr:hypothetical protein D9615_004477 [Tricholomella constricta]